MRKAVGTAEAAAADNDANKLDEIGDAEEKELPNLESCGEDTLISFASLIRFITEQ